MNVDPATTGARLLYVEDNNDLREVLSTLLSGEGYLVDVAACAGEGLERLRTARFDLVISDYALPDHTGTWMLREAAASGLLDRTETLLITANADPERTGFTPILHKPLAVEHLLEHIARLLAPSPSPGGPLAIPGRSGQGAPPSAAP